MPATFLVCRNNFWNAPSRSKLCVSRNGRRFPRRQRGHGKGRSRPGRGGRHASRTRQDADRRDCLIGEGERVIGAKVGNRNKPKVDIAVALWTALRLA
jgi:hypothetical protein